MITVCSVDVGFGSRCVTDILYLLKTLLQNVIFLSQSQSFVVFFDETLQE